MAPVNAQVHYLSSAFVPGRDSWPAEALFISALIATGDYRPGAYGISDAHFSACKDVHAFCKDHQAKAGRAPDAGLLARRFARFEYVPNIDPTWAAADMKDAWVSRQLRKGMTQATNLLAEDDIHGAIGALRSTLTTATPSLTKGTGVADFTDIEAAHAMSKAAIDWDLTSYLQTYTGGIGPGELWYIAARLGVGKTWELIKRTVAIAEAGWNVVFFSTEMPARAVKERFHRVALRDVGVGYDNLPLNDRRDRIEAWQASSGHVTIFDPSSGPCDAVRVAAAASEDTVAVIDYIGLMRTTAGTRSIEDWRAAATISNELKEVSLEYGMPILAAAQINREGQKSSKMGAEHLSQADALGQDADVIMTIRQYSTRVRVNALVKNRHGLQDVRWYTRFDPTAARFDDITSEQAHLLASQDEEALSAQMD